MKEENKHCYNCRWYCPLYTKEYRNFDKQNWGLCKKKEVKEKHNVCEGWCYNTEFNRRFSSHFTNKAALKALNDIIQNLTEVGQILKEAQEIDDY